MHLLTPILGAQTETNSGRKIGQGFETRNSEKATLISERGLYLCRQRPTLPHTFACSTIGPAGLNFRVRDGNGWSPRGKITDKSQLSAISRQLSATCAAPTFKADAQQTCKRSQPPLPINPRADS